MPYIYIPGEPGSSYIAKLVLEDGNGIFLGEVVYSGIIGHVYRIYSVCQREREGKKKVNTSKLKTVKSNYFTRMIKELNKSILELC